MVKHKTLISIFIIITLILLVINPEQNINSCKEGLTVWATIWLPAILPFFILTKLLCELKTLNKLTNKLTPLSQKLFGVSGIGIYIFIVSAISGYPIGAKLVKDYYESGQITKEEAYKITTFSTTSGPMFIIGTVGIGMFKNIKIGIVIYISHIISAIINGIIYKNYKLKNEKNNIIKIENNNIISMQKIILESINSLTIVGCYIAIFFTIINIINNIGVLNPINNIINIMLGNKPEALNIISSITSGIVEMTKGCMQLSQTNIISALTPIILTAIITFGGISINTQILTFLNRIKMNKKFYFTQRLSHILISIIICNIINIFVQF